MTPSDLFEYFDRVYVINLDRRSDRWRRFVQLLPATWPFGPPLRFSAVDGHLETPPDYWSENRGAWGCYQSHLRALEHAIEHGFERILVLEDDAVCCDDFAEQVRRFIAELPHDWKLIFLGGQHIEVHLGRPKQISEMVYAPYNANRMHAYAFQGAATFREVHSFLSDQANWTALHHVDHFLGAYQKRTSKDIYVPRKWLIAQDSGLSDIAQRELDFRAFLGAEDIVHPKVVLPMVAVMGPFSSGTSAVAGVLHQLGISMGRSFEIPDATNYRGHFEAAELARMCRHMFNEPWMTEAVTRSQRIELLKIWAAGQTRTFQNTATMVGGKHPSFCMLGPELVEAWNKPHIISVERDEQDVVNSLVRRNWGWPLDTCLAITQQLISSRQSFLSTTSTPVLRIQFEALKQEPANVIQQILKFLDYRPTSQALESAISFVQR